jgi:hypothetical protein
VASRAKPAAAEGQPDFAVCATAGAFADLARLPPGLAVNEIDMGPAILAFTRHAAMSAPYHRMPQGIRAAHAVLSAPPEEARARLAALGASYVVICAGPPQAQPSGGPERLADGLARGSVPPWLEPIGTGTALRAFRVRGTEAQPAR